MKAGSTYRYKIFIKCTKDYQLFWLNLGKYKIRVGFGPLSKIFEPIVLSKEALKNRNFPVVNVYLFNLLSLNSHSHNLCCKGFNVFSKFLSHQSVQNLLVKTPEK